MTEREGPEGGRAPDTEEHEAPLPPVPARGRRGAPDDVPAAEEPVAPPPEPEPPDPAEAVPPAGHDLGPRPAYPTPHWMQRDPAAVEAERRRNRLVAIGALGAFAVLFVIIVASAFIGGGDEEQTLTPEERRAAAARERERTTTTTTRRQAQRPSGAVPANAPGAHRAPDEPVPILVYQVIDEPANPNPPQPERFIPAGDFEEQMEALRDDGYHAVTLDQVWQAWNRGGLLPENPIVITFDDGWRSHYTNALPVLRRLNWPGVLNLRLEAIGQELTEDQIRGLIRAGWEIDSKTFGDAALTGLDPIALDRELAGSREELRGTFDVPANFVAYPQGVFDTTVIEAAEEAGYRGGQTLEEGIGRKDEIFELDRIPILADDGVEGLRQKLRDFGTTDE